MYKYIKQGVCLGLIFLTVAFIFYNSAQTVPESKEAATSVAETIAPMTKNEYETPADWRSFVSLVRKAAHAVEFFVLGAELSIFFLALRQRKGVQSVWNLLSLALAVAVADESIQILSGRGPKVQDVLLDFCGTVCAVALFSLVYFPVSALVRRRRQRKNQITVSDGV